MKRFVVALIALSLVNLNFSSASAMELERSGSCSAGSIWHADLELEYKVFDLGFEVDTRKAEEAWTFTLKQNGKRVISDTRTAIKDFDDSYAEVEWDLIRPDRNGSDKFAFRAVNQSSGEICKVTLRA